MRTIILLIIVLSASSVFAQSDLQKMVNTEQAFARLAADKDTRSAFLAKMNDDAVVFVPEQTKAKPYWEARTANKTLLSWAPNFADISSNGILGYTTGNWEFRAKGKDDKPSAFGDFVTLWLRQPDGTYKWVVDMGIEHAKPAKYSTEWTTFQNETSVKFAKVKPTADASSDFYQLAASKGLAKAYEKFADENIRSYHEGKVAILGKAAVLNLLKSDKAEFSAAKRSSTFTSENISYNLNTYTRTQAGKILEKGNFLQIWKFYNGKWYIVLDVFIPLGK